MADLGGTYSAEGGATMEERDALPAGEYVAKIVKSERREARAKNGNAYINLEFAVDEGQCEGRRFWTMLNLWNNNATAVEIAQRELNSICHAVGKLRVSDTDELHGIPMRVKLKVKTDDYGAKNEVTSYSPLNAAPGASSSASGGGDNQPVWKRTA